MNFRTSITCFKSSKTQEQTDQMLNSMNSFEKSVAVGARFKPSGPFSYSRKVDNVYSYKSQDLIFSQKDVYTSREFELRGDHYLFAKYRLSPMPMRDIKIVASSIVSPNAKRRRFNETKLFNFMTQSHQRLNMF